MAKESMNLQKKLIAITSTQMDFLNYYAKIQGTTASQVIRDLLNEKMAKDGVK
jgi:hypothetical protein